MFFINKASNYHAKNALSMSGVGSAYEYALFVRIL